MKLFVIAHVYRNCDSQVSRSRYVLHTVGLAKDRAKGIHYHAGSFVPLTFTLRTFCPPPGCLRFVPCLNVSRPLKIAHARWRKTTDGEDSVILSVCLFLRRLSLYSSPCCPFTLASAIFSGRNVLEQNVHNFSKIFIGHLAVDVFVCLSVCLLVCP